MDDMFPGYLIESGFVTLSLDCRKEYEQVEDHKR